MSCVLVEDITSDKLPPNLALLLSSLSSPDPSDYVLLAVYTLMLESGFSPVDPDQPVPVFPGRGFDMRRLETFNRLPYGWDDKTRTLHRLTLQLEDLSQPTCQFVVLRIGGMITVNLAVDDYPSSCVREPLYTMPLLPWDYVETTSTGLAYKDMQQLSTLFKDTMVAPIVSGIFRRYGMSHASLVGIPHEVTLKILRRLPATVVCAVSQACRSLNDVCQDDRLWQHLYVRDKITPPKDGGDADVSFKSKYSKAVVWEAIAVMKRRMKPKVERRIPTQFHDNYYGEIPHRARFDPYDWSHLAGANFRAPSVYAFQHNLAPVANANPWQHWH